MAKAIREPKVGDDVLFRLPSGRETVFVVQEILNDGQCFIGRNPVGKRNVFHVDDYGDGTEQWRYKNEPRGSWTSDNGYKAPSMSSRQIWPGMHFDLDLDRAVMDAVYGTRTAPPPQPEKIPVEITPEMIEAGAEASFLSYQQHYLAEANARGVFLCGKVQWSGPDNFVPDLGTTWKNFHREKAKAVIEAVATKAVIPLGKNQKSVTITPDNVQRLWNELDEYTDDDLDFSVDDLRKELHGIFGEHIVVTKRPRIPEIALALNLKTNMPPSLAADIVTFVAEAFGIAEQVK